MGSLFSSRSPRANQTPQSLPDLQLRIQTSVLGRPRPIGWGRVRMAANMILATNFVAGYQPSLGSGASAGSGGKGGVGTVFGKGAQTPTITYTANYWVDCIMAFGQSQVAGIVNVWNGQGLVQYKGPGQSGLNLNNINAIANPNGAAGGTLYHGDYSQTNWPTTGSLGPGSLAYRGEAYLAFGSMNLGGSSTIPQYNFELDFTIGFDLPSVSPDANPVDVITDYLTDPDHGVPQFLSAYLADMSDFRLYCRAFSLLVSFVETQQRPASEMLGELAKVLNVDFVWSSGKLKVVPYTPFPGTQNGYVWNPQLTPQYAFNDTHFLPNQGSLGGSASGDTTVAISRKARAKAVNHTKLEFLPRGNYYNPWLLDYIDEGSVANWGVEIIGDVVQAHHFALDAAAQSSLVLLAARNQVVRTFQFTVGRRFILLDPMDLVTITDTTTGLNNQPALITEIQENADGTLTFTLEEYLALVGPPAYGYSTISVVGTMLNVGGSPGNINAPVIYEPPDQLGGGLVIWIAVSGQNAILWGGCDVYASYDGVSYTNIGRIVGASRMGVTTGSLPSVPAAVVGPTIDGTNTLAVNLAESNGSLLSGSAADFAALNTLCLVDGELVAYENATLTGTNAYNLAPLTRGCYGSQIAAHASGASFVRLSKGTFSYDYTQDRIGSTLYLKFTSFNTFGGGEQALSDVGAYTYVIQGTALSSPLPNVTNLRTVFVGSVTQLYWDEVSDFRPVQYQVRKGASWTTSQIVANLAHPPFVLTGDDTYWIAAVSQPTAGLVVYSATPQSIAVAGSQITQNVILYFDEDGKEAGTAYWPGTMVNCGTDLIGLRLMGSGNILSEASVLTTPDVLNYGGLSASGSYTSTSTVNAGRTTQMLVQANWQAIGVKIGTNILSDPNVLADLDVLGAANTRFVSVYPVLRVGVWNGTGITWGSWQKYQAGVYQGQYLQMQLALATIDPNTIAYCTDFDWTVSLSPRIDHYLNLSIPSGGMTITFTPDQLAGGPAQSAAAFNGGPDAGNLPSVLATWPNSSGDTLVISALSLSSVFVQIQNGGVGVARSGVNIVAEGY